MLDELEVTCAWRNAGCAWQGHRSALAGHLRSGCEHVACRHCADVRGSETVVAAHEQECPQAPVPCPHAADGCEEKLKRLEVAAHQDRCVAHAEAERARAAQAHKAALRRAAAAREQQMQKVREHEALTDKLQCGCGLCVCANVFAGKTAALSLIACAGESDTCCSTLSTTATQANVPTHKRENSTECLPKEQKTHICTWRTFQPFPNRNCHSTPNTPQPLA